MYMYNSSVMFGIHNAMSVLHSSPLKITCPRLEFVRKLLFLDKSIGGYTGISPTRFLIRQYPDPKTESFSFWRLLLDHFSKSVKLIASKAWNPVVKKRRPGWIRELAENPAGLSIEGGSNIENIFKQEGKTGKYQKQFNKKFVGID